MRFSLKGFFRPSYNLSLSHLHLLSLSFFFSLSLSPSHINSISLLYTLPSPFIIHSRSLTFSLCHSFSEFSKFWPIFFRSRSSSGGGKHLLPRGFLILNKIGTTRGSQWIWQHRCLPTRFCFQHQWSTVRILSSTNDMHVVICQVN